MTTSRSFFDPVINAPELAPGPERVGPWGAVVWFTGLSGAGKSTLAQGVHARLRQQGLPSAVLDGDLLRDGQVAEFTGITSPYEAPLMPEMVLDTAHTSSEHSIELVLQALKAMGRPGSFSAGAIA